MVQPTATLDFSTLESYKRFISTFDKIDLDDYEVYNLNSIKNPLQDLLDFIEKDSEIFHPPPPRRSKTLDKLKRQTQGASEATENVASEDQRDEANYHYGAKRDNNDSLLETTKSSPQRKSRIVKSEPEVVNERASVPVSTNERANVPVSANEKAGDGWATLLVYTCGECDVRVREADRARHEAEHHDGETQGGQAGPVQYQCLVCISNIDWSEETIRTHLAGHERTLEDYKEQFEEPISLQIKKQTEMIKKELDKKPRTRNKTPGVSLKCEDCGKKYTTNFALQRHKKNEHKRGQSKIKQERRDVEENGGFHHCKTCKFKSNRKGALTFHISKYHDINEKIECCGKTFSSRWCLFVHLHDKHREERELYNKHQIWPGLDKYM